LDRFEKHSAKDKKYYDKVCEQFRIIVDDSIGLNDEQIRLFCQAYGEDVALFTWELCERMIFNGKVFITDYMLDNPFDRKLILWNPLNSNSFHLNEKIVGKKGKRKQEYTKQDGKYYIKIDLKTQKFTLKKYTEDTDTPKSSGFLASDTNSGFSETPVSTHAFSDTPVSSSPHSSS
jgi:hypothetical protein